MMCGVGRRTNPARGRVTSPLRRTVRAGTPRGEGGSVTAELAVALPAVVVVLLLVLGVGAASTAQVRVVDAARTGARLAAIGDDDGAVVAAVRRLVGDSAEVGVVRDPPWVTVSVRTAVVADIQVGASATAWVEP